MTINDESLQLLIDAELIWVHDTRVVSHVRAILREPYAILRSWDYGLKGQQYLCWMVLKDTDTGAEIGYCESGFGPECPWGLISSGADHRIGMDSGWFPTFMAAYFESAACTTLPIWRVFRTEPGGAKAPLTAEGDWAATWREVMQLRENDPARRYDCGHSIYYDKPTGF